MSQVHAQSFARLARSKFRSRFHLTEEDRRYIERVGMKTIRRHCEDFVRTRLAPANPPNDGRQTPMRGHPVFKAQHAITAPCGGARFERTTPSGLSEEVPRVPSACCCRGCLAKWWKMPRGVEIPAERQKGIVDFLMAWIERDNRR